MSMELLAPAGSAAAFYAAISAGADAVYLGGQSFGARANAQNLDTDELRAAIRYAHVLGKRLYLTVNTLVKESEFPKLYQYLKPLYEDGLDAVIVQDPGVLLFVQNVFPDLPIHASTQMCITGKEGAALLKSLGVRRLIPARELSLSEIREIHACTDIEIETFIHGALCYSYSGRCLISSFIGGRSGNRGLCAQPCRLPYQIFDTDGKICNQGKENPISLKDISLIDRLLELQKAGISSLKIEGRMKKPEYTAGVVSIYRKYLDLLEENKEYRVEQTDLEMLAALFNRNGFSEGYYYQQNGADMMAFSKSEQVSRIKNAEKAYEKANAYVDGRKKAMLNGSCVIKGKQAYLNLQTMIRDPDDNFREITGFAKTDQVQPAQKAALTAENVEGHLRKTGDTNFAFDRLDVTVESGLFLPVKELKQLRKDAISDLERKIDACFFRAAAKPEPIEKKLSLPLIEKQTVSICVYTWEQFLCAKNMEGADEIILPAEFLFCKDHTAEIRKIAKQKKLRIAMPQIMRTIPKKKYELLKSLILEHDLALLVRNMEDCAWALKNDLAKRVRLDHSLYVMNEKAGDFYRKLGIEKFTVPVELNEKEIASFENADAELIVYGRTELMISAQCLGKNLGKCTGDHGIYQMKDRLGNLFPVLFSCDFCYNSVMNAYPTSLLGSFDALKKLGCGSYRLSFTDEDTEQMTKICSAFFLAFAENRSVKEWFPFTRGHFHRGVL